MEWRLAILMITLCELVGAQVFHQDPIPSFSTVGTRYPNLNEDEQCRPIKLRLIRHSTRFTATLVRNTNNEITYDNEDARFMSSRLKFRLDLLAEWYFSNYNAKLKVLLAYAEPSTVTDRSDSLHYEGRSARIAGALDSHLPFILYQAVLFGFDWVIYANISYCRVSVIPDVCQTNLDLLFLLDQSGSVGSSNHHLALQFIQAVVNFFEVGGNNTRVGLFTFSTGARVDLIFNPSLTTQEVVSFIGQIPYRGGWTQTAWALYYATIAFTYPELNGARPISAGIPRIVVLITDGRSNHYSITQHAINLLDTGATVYSIGIGNVYTPELNEIASDPDSDHVFLLNSYTDAASFVQLLSGTTCDTPANIPPGETPETEVEEDDFKYFQVQCGTFSTTVIIEQYDIIGHCAVYVSLTIVNPGPLSPTTEVFSNDTINVSRRRVIISVGIGGSVYISIRGITVINRFRMVVWNMLFSEDEYCVEIQSGDPANTQVIDLDIVNATNDNLYFFNITDGNSAGRFEINDETGVITTTQSLLAMQQSYYELTIIAYLRADDCQRGRTIVKVTLTTENVNAPVFQATSPVSINETALLNTDVIQVIANDSDFGVNGEVRYFITNGNDNNAFIIDSVTGIIRTAARLNHTITPSYNLTIEARDQAVMMPMTVMTTQVINVIDVNQRPFFIMQCAITGRCIFSVPEDASLGVTVGHIEVGDPDSATLPNGQVTLALNPAASFSISSGNITLASVLDRETQDNFVLNLTVMDGGTPPLDISTKVQVTILDINDNAPVISALSTISVPEDRQVGDTILQVTSSDADIGDNAIVSYSLTGSLMFDIDNNTGAISVAQSLDYETITNHTVDVTASNPDGLESSPHSILILVTNVNDNSPMFSMDTYTGTVIEGSAPGTSVVMVTATDADLDLPGVVEYIIMSGNVGSAFTININSGVITVNSNIDREVISEYTLTVRAQDSGMPRRSDTSIVRITVTDINDNIPVFQRSQYSLIIHEDVNVPSTYITLVATDADEPGTVNSAVSYTIDSGNIGMVFSLSETTGTLILQSSLDFESTPSYSLIVVATDNGSVPLSSNAIVFVTVVNVNDEIPTLSGDQNVSISESTTVPRTVASFTAMDEVGDTLQFTLTGNQNCEFSINTSSGVVTLVKALDYELVQQYELTVTVSDGQFSDTSILRINVLDDNDNTPIFTMFGPFTIREEESSNTIVGNVVASDADSEMNAEITLSSTSGSSMFNISDSGQIRTVAILDRESIGSDLSFNVTATDNGIIPLSSEVTVSIQLQDINDNAPVLQSPPTEVNVSENTAIQTMILRIQATDEDIGNNAVVFYYISENVFFAIDNSTGIITLIDNLDYETATEHTINVTAENPDGVSSPEHSILIRVINENDNTPVFTMNPYTAMVEESSGIGTFVINVTANDADTGTLGVVHYSIVSGNVGGVFIIDADSGTITVNGHIDREMISNYALTVGASDLGSSRKKRQSLSPDATSVVRIQVSDVNDNPPAFQQSPYSVTLREDAPLGIILSLIVTDADEPNTPNSMITLSIEAGNSDGKFSLDNSSRLTLVDSLDFETQSVYVLTVRAQDQGTPSLSASTMVNITVTNINDLFPVISGNQVVNVSEFLQLSSEVANFTATGEEGESLVFSLTGDTTRTFQINDQTGVVTLAKSLDYELRTAYILQVIVSDGLFSSFSTLTVNVLDENDNDPQIAPVNPLSVDEEMPANTPVGNITAFDVDSGVNAQLTFAISPAAINDYLYIDNGTGEIYTANVLDREQLTNNGMFVPPESSETFNVTVTDGGSPMRSAEVVVTFTLRDINDNAPVFTDLNNEVNISESSAIGFEIVQVTAKDADIGVNAELQFSSMDDESTFTIDDVTGTLSLSITLDYETTQTHIVNIAVTDGMYVTNRSLTVNVLDENDNSPYFVQNNYTATVPENSPTNLTVTTVQAFDADSHVGEFGKVFYGLQGGGNEFAIAAGIGMIIVNTPNLDRETVSQYTLTAVATDYGVPVRSVTTQVVVTISDENDNAPSFQQSFYRSNIREDAGNESNVITVLATDADEPGNNNSIIDYSLNDTSVFTIGSSSGTIKLISSLNFETTSVYTLTVIARDRGSPSLNGTATVIITVLNINDEPPMLSGNQSQSLNLSEFTPVNTQIIQYTVTGESANETITFSLNGSQSDHFAINSTTGVVTLVQYLDYEVIEFYSLNVFVNDGRFVSTSQLNITVLDENDNSPQFEPIGTLQVDEEMPSGTSIGQVTATDADSGVNQVITYSFVQPSTANLFTINSVTGEIVTAVVLDREVLVQQNNIFLPPASQLTFQVQATDGGTPSLFSQVDITVMLVDVNDNAPVFVNPVSMVDIPELRPVGQITVITATDADIGENARIIYSLTGSALFFIDGSTGGIFLNGTLDYESNTSHTVVVTAANPDGLQSTSHSIVIRVTDENDNSPIFSPDSYTATVAENSAVGTFVVNVSATDVDSGMLGVVHYSIVGGNDDGLFSIAAISGTITVNGDIDREAIDNLSLMVRATDLGSTPRSTETMVTINVSDINDNIPVFNSSVYMMNFRENAEVSSFLLTVVATDTDATLPNNQITYSRTGSDSSHFSIAQDGNITLTSELDFETQEVHNFFALAVDGGDPSLTGTAEVVITVINENDLPPVVNGDRNISILESTSVGTRITQVTASGEEGEIITFSLNITNPFIIDNQTGVISVNETLDFEMTTSYIVQVLVSDGLLTVIHELLVNILDVNDNVPLITSAGPFVFEEEISLNTSIGNVTASDADSGVNAQLTYTLLQPENIDFFSINSITGEIFIATRIDRESIDTSNPQPDIMIIATLQVSDNGSPALTTSRNVEFRIIEINDNAPQFVNPVNSIDIRETIPVGEMVTQVTASDADIGGDNITYKITGSSFFAINSSSGVITLADSLDYETATEHIINVTAANPDPGGLTSAPHSILVRVINENDNSPIFTMNPYRAAVLEGSSINGVFVVTVQADDADSGVLGEVRYSIIDGNDGDAFTINATDGEVTVNNDIDRETMDVYILTVTATDLGIPSRLSQSRINITIGDINDNPPLFDPLFYTVQVLENVSVNSFLTTVMVTDADIPPNSDIMYSITEGSDLFNISQDGSLFTASSLDFETTTSYSVVVQAANNNTTPVLSAFGTVTVIVLDVNDEPPSLVADTIITVSEQASINSVVTQFSVQNLEVGDVITFHLSGNMSEVFSINPTSGLLTLAQALDYEMQQSYVLLVTASDGIFTGSIEIQVDVQDENDNSPIFQESGPFTIMEELPSNSLVGKVAASDADSGDNGNLSYTIIRNVANLFSINIRTGEIRTTSMLDRESLVTMNLFVPPISTESITVQAEDNGSPTLFSQVEVRITLEDINDNSPMFVIFQEELSYPENIFNNSVILEISATDSDQDENGVVTYSLASNDSLPFAIDSSTGVVTTTETLDRETTDHYVFEVVASDNGTVVQSSSIEVTLEVTDINDNPPVFINTPYMEQIPENIAIDGGASFTLLMVQTTDQDIGVNAIVTYSLAPGTSTQFSIRNTTGDFRVSGSFNFEGQSEINVTVIATDGGLPALTSTTIVNIVITNRFAPVFDGPCDANVSEDASVNTVVTRCPATDSVSGLLFYQSFSLSISNVFEIGFETAEIFLRGPLDRESIDQYTFTLQSGSLLGNPITNEIAEMDVTITVLDVNDNAPVFNPDRHEISFNLDSLRSDILVTLNVTDADINENGEFSIMMSRNTTDNVHTITVTAVDMGTPALTGTATIIVTDEIDCEVIEFELDEVTRQILVFAFCSVMNQVSSNYLFNTSEQLNCQAVTNLPVTYQWQLNGTSITNQSSNPILDLGRVDFDDVGSYSCIARTRLGNIQTNTANIRVHSMPVIEGSPEDDAVEINRIVRLSCFASGVPAPDITFYHNDVEVVLDSRVSQIGPFLVITRAVMEDQGTYYCNASNVVGFAISNSSMLIVFNTDELVTTTLLISNPNEDGTCHNLDINMIEDIIESSTERGAEVSEDETKAVDGEFCEPNSCYPNPCKNKGRCTVNENATDGYICVCPDTFTGVNCQNDVDECVSDNPCLFDSNCTNMQGFFQCICPPGREGHRCQYEINCNDSSLCTEGETCVETVANPSGYVCISTPVSERLQIQLSDDVTTNQVNEALYRLTDRLLELDPNSTDFCEPQFTAANGTDNYNLTLVWGCPNGTDPLGIDAEDLICQDLLNASLVVMCLLSDGTTQEPPKFNLEPISVQVTFILFNPNTNQPLSASQAVQILQNSDAQSALLSDNVQSSSMFRAFMETGDDGEEDDEGGLGGGATAGVVIAVLVVIVVLTLLAIYTGYKYYSKSNYSGSQSKTLATLQSNIEDGRNRSQTVTGMFDNSAFDNKGKKLSVGGDTVFENPTFNDAPVITKLGGNTEPVTRSAITRITTEESTPSVSSETVLLS